MDREPDPVFPASVPPICAGFMNTISRTGEPGDSTSMISRRYGVRLVRHRPDSEFQEGKTMC